LPTATASATYRVADIDAGSVFLAALAPLANLGLQGADWATAFDLEALGSPIGLRLHALLCVWRN
jgi:hypothetical protein